ncbi:MAG TPA: hypothetical protein VK935_08315, partial [Actinomycetospora sp.]|nr:hypothetical protein [Actinomycetospora sp.]
VVPPRAVRAGARRLTGAETRLTTAPGGHLGVLAGRAAKDTTWARLCAFLDRHDAPATVEGSTPTSRRSLRPARLSPRRAVEPVRSTAPPAEDTADDTAEDGVETPGPLPAITSAPEPEDPDSPTHDDPDVAGAPASAGTGSRSRSSRRSTRLPAPKRASRTPRRR